MFGLNWKDLVKLVLNNRGQEYSQSLKNTLKERYVRNMKKKVEAMPNIYLLLEMTKKNFKVALGTNSRYREVEIIFNKLDFDKYFDLKLARDHVKNPKPNPEIYLKAAELLGVKPNECIVFEDSIIGVKAAKAAGMYCIALVNTYTKDNLKEADILVNNYNEITLDVLKNMDREKSNILSVPNSQKIAPKQSL